MHLCWNPQEERGTVIGVHKPPVAEVVRRYLIGASCRKGAKESKRVVEWQSWVMSGDQQNQQSWWLPNSDGESRLAS